MQGSRTIPSLVRSRLGGSPGAPWLVLAAVLGLAAAGWSQEIIRPGPPAREDFETDADHDGAPDGWYNLRDAQRAEGGVVGPNCLKFENTRPGRAARASRAFGADGREIEALVVGLWIRLHGTETGERLDEEPGLLIDLLDEQLHTVGRGLLGPWRPRELGTDWMRIARRIPVPPNSRDAILTVGLLGSTGTLEIDGLTIETVPRGGSNTTNLILNGGIELGSDRPDHWIVEGGAKRVSPGQAGDAALELTRAGARAQVGLSLPASRFEALQVRLSARASKLRGAGGAGATLYFLDPDGNAAGAGIRLFRWGGTFDWTEQRLVVPVPPGPRRAVLQFDKPDPAGSLRLDQVEITAQPNPSFGTWKPYHEQEETGDWKPFVPASTIEAGSALDFSRQVVAPAGRQGRVVVKNGKLHYANGPRARLFGVALLPPTGFLDSERADALVDRLAKSGVNLVRLSGLDAALGAGQSLIDDARDDTRAFDPEALRRLDHLIAALKARGIHVALELQSLRRFREQDEITEARSLPPGGGPAAAFDENIRKRALAFAETLLGHVNPETKLPLRDDPVLALVTLAGELSLFDQIDQPNLLPAPYVEALRDRQHRSSQGTGRRFWQAVESEQWTAEAEALRSAGLKAPIAGSSHWRREPELAATEIARGLDFIDDRLYWFPPPWSAGDRRSILFDAAGNLAAQAVPKRRIDRPYVVGEWAAQTFGAGAWPYEAADLLAVVRTAMVEDWDGLVRRGITTDPAVWGAAPPGGVVTVPEAINGIPQVIALLPHAASLFLRGREMAPTSRRLIETPGRLALETPFTATLAGWTQDRPLITESVRIDIESPFGVVAVSAVGDDPLAKASRLLVTAVARSLPTGLAWTDSWRREVADPGQAPLLMEPVRARILWKHQAKPTAYLLDNAGKRLRPATIEAVRDGHMLTIEGSEEACHWELVAG